MPTEPYKPGLLKRLGNKKYAAVYLKESFDETLKDNDYEVFLTALRDVVEANGSVQDIAADADITRQHLHRLLAGDGNPTPQTLAGVLKALDLSIDFVPVKK